MAKKSSINAAALAVVGKQQPVDFETLPKGQICHSVTFDSDALFGRAVAMLEQLGALKQERAMKAVLAGIYFEQLKNALPHGEFSKAREKHIGAKDIKTSTRLMALARAFCKTTKLLLPEIVASQQITLALEAPGSDAQAFKRKLEKFVGERGLTELYHLHGVIKVGGNHRPVVPPTPEERHAAWVQRTKAEALGAFNGMHTLGDKWKLCDDDQLALAIANAEKFLKQARKWLITPPDKRLQVLAATAGDAAEVTGHEPEVAIRNRPFYAVKMRSGMVMCFEWSAAEIGEALMNKGVVGVIRCIEAEGMIPAEAAANKLFAAGKFEPSAIAKLEVAS